MCQKYSLRLDIRVLIEGCRLRSGSKKENTMKNSTKDQVKGKVHEVKGAVKEKVGHATNDPNLEAEGQDEQVAGTIQKKIGQIEKVAGQ